MVDGKQTVSPNGAFRRLFRARCRKNAKPNSLLEAIAKASREGTGFVSQSEENGVVRIKMVVKKTDLAQVLEAMGSDGGRGEGAAPASVSVEQRLALMRRKQLLRAKLAAATWSPALQSIPEIDSF